MDQKLFTPQDKVFICDPDLGGCGRPLGTIVKSDGITQLLLPSGNFITDGDVLCNPRDGGCGRLWHWYANEAALLRLLKICRFAQERIKRLTADISGVRE